MPIWDIGNESAVIEKLTSQPALAREIAFYQLLNGSSRSQPIHRLKAFLPRFFGTLRLEGRMQPNGVLKEDIPEKGEVPEVSVRSHIPGLSCLSGETSGHEDRGLCSHHVHTSEGHMCREADCTVYSH